MKPCLTACLIVLGLPTIAFAQTGHDHHAGHGAPAAAGYTSLGDREIKALSDEELEGLLQGEGLGFALTAELNGIPGPLHILELAEPLGLTTEQREAVQRIFSGMREETRRLGAELVEVERMLDRRFAHRHIDADVVRELTGQIGELRGKIRAVHLIAHLDVDPLLTEEQRTAYRVLRGYEDPQDEY